MRRIQFFEINDPVKPVQNIVIVGHCNECRTGLVFVIEKNVEDFVLVVWVQITGGFIGK